MALADKVLPIGLAALGTGYFTYTMLKKPAGGGAALAEWERHKRDAQVALAAGLGAATVLLMVRGAGGGEAFDRDSFT